MTLLSILAVPLIVGIAASMSRRSWWDRRASARHHQAIEVLGRITKEQAEAAGAVQNTSGGAHSNLRVIATTPSETAPPLPPRRAMPSRARDSKPAQAASAPAPGAPPPRLPPPAVKDVPRPPTRPAVVRRPDLSSGPTQPPVADPVATATSLLPAGPPAPAGSRTPGVTPAPAVSPAPSGVFAQTPGINGSASSPPRILHFEDTPPAGIDVVGEFSGPPVRPSAKRHPRPARRVPTRTLLVASAGVLVIGGAAAGGVIATSGRSKANGPRASAPPASAPAGSAPLVTQEAAPPATAAPPVTGPIQQTAGNGSAAWVYHVPPAAQVALTASGSCWVDAHQGDSRGQTVYTGTMSRGQTQSLSGPLWIRIGNPLAMSITVDGSVLTPPPAVRGEAYNVQFVVS